MEKSSDTIHYYYTLYICTVGYTLRKLKVPNKYYYKPSRFK